GCGTPRRTGSVPLQRLPYPRSHTRPMDWTLPLGGLRTSRSGSRTGLSGRAPRARREAADDPRGSRPRPARTRSRRRPRGPTGHARAPRARPRAAPLPPPRCRPPPSWPDRSHPSRESDPRGRLRRRDTSPHRRGRPAPAPRSPGRPPRRRLRLLDDPHDDAAVLAVRPRLAPLRDRVEELGHLRRVHGLGGVLVALRHLRRPDARVAGRAVEL